MLSATSSHLDPLQSSVSSYSGCLGLLVGSDYLEGASCAGSILDIGVSKNQGPYNIDPTR